MRVISFKDTVLFKRGFWLAGAALMVAIGAPSLLDGSLLAQPLVRVTPLVLLAAFLVYLLGQTRLYALLDEVIDCGTHLQVRRGSIQDLVPWSAIASVDVMNAHRWYRIRVHLRVAGRLGKRLEFWPPASLWGNLPAVEHVAEDIARRLQSTPADRQRFQESR